MAQEAWEEEEEYEQIQPPPRQLRQQQQRAMQYEEDVEAENWSEEPVRRVIGIKNQRYAEVATLRSDGKSPRVRLRRRTRRRCLGR